jgi:hypothetical protein
VFFFQIFFLVILFALYNGLVVLPVVLSIAGPSSDNASWKFIKAMLTGKDDEKQEAAADEKQKLNGKLKQKENEKEEDIQGRNKEIGKSEHRLQRVNSKSLGRHSPNVSTSILRLFLLQFFSKPIRMHQILPHKEELWKNCRKIVDRFCGPSTGRGGRE